MRLGSRTSNEFVRILNERNESIKGSYLSRMADLTQMIDLKVMMGDSTVTEQKTFDPKLVTDYFQGINDSLIGWSVQNVSITNNQDVRRIFTKFETRVGNYAISGHLSLQFHVLLYYKPDQRVIDCQKELAAIVDSAKDREERFSDDSDQIVLKKLRERGYRDFDHQELFRIFYEDDKLREEISSEMDADEDFRQLEEKKSSLFSELDSLLIETYQTSAVLIDDPKLVGGEEGFLLALDLEFVKNDIRQGVFDPRKISEQTRKDILNRLTELKACILFNKTQGTG